MTDMVWSSSPSFPLQRTNNDNDNVVSSRTPSGHPQSARLLRGVNTTVRQAHVARRAIACLYPTWHLTQSPTAIVACTARVISAACILGHLPSTLGTLEAAATTTGPTIDAAIFAQVKQHTVFSFGWRRVSFRRTERDVTVILISRKDPLLSGHLSVSDTYSG